MWVKAGWSLILPIFTPEHSVTMWHQQHTCVTIYSRVLSCFVVSQALRENTYPFLAVIVLKDNKMTVVARIEGLMCKYSLSESLIFKSKGKQPLWD